MSRRRVRINYAEVHSRTGRYTSAIRNQLNVANQNYNQLLNSVKSLDSATNAALIEAIERNMEKATATAKILEKLLSFIDASTRQMKNQEDRMAQGYMRGEGRGHSHAYRI
jgi:uncharacterized protein with PIN domain